MYTLLLTVIYLAFISLGLPDSLLGSAWPVMQINKKLLTKQLLMHRSSLSVLQ